MKNPIAKLALSFAAAFLLGTPRVDARSDKNGPDQGASFEPNKEFVHSPFARDLDHSVGGAPGAAIAPRSGPEGKRGVGAPAPDSSGTGNKWQVRHVGVHTARGFDLAGTNNNMGLVTSVSFNPMGAVFLGLNMGQTQTFGAAAENQLLKIFDIPEEQDVLRSIKPTKTWSIDAGLHAGNTMVGIGLKDFMSADHWYDQQNQKDRGPQLYVAAQANLRMFGFEIPNRHSVSSRLNFNLVFRATHQPGRQHAPTAVEAGIGLSYDSGRKLTVAESKLAPVHKDIEAELAFGPHIGTNGLGMSVGATATYWPNFFQGSNKLLGVELGLSAGVRGTYENVGLQMAENAAHEFAPDQVTPRRSATYFVMPHALVRVSDVGVGVAVTSHGIQPMAKVKLFKGERGSLDLAVTGKLKGEHQNIQVGLQFAGPFAKTRIFRG